MLRPSTGSHATIDLFGVGVALKRAASASAGTGACASTPAPAASLTTSSGSKWFDSNFATEGRAVVTLELRGRCEMVQYRFHAAVGGEAARPDGLGSCSMQPDGTFVLSAQSGGSRRRAVLPQGDKSCMKTAWPWRWTRARAGGYPL